jgi:hypothetical protein
MTDVIGGHRMKPYYADDHVTLWHGDCREVIDWLAADILVTDPPYGASWHQQSYRGTTRRETERTKHHTGISNDNDTAVRDWIVRAFAPKPGVIFGRPMIAPPEGCKAVLVWQKPADSGLFGNTGPWRRDWEAVYVVGSWPREPAVSSSILRSASGSHRQYAQGIHPHAKPLDLMATLIQACPPGVIADPSSGSGSTLVAAKALGRRAIGVELNERDCEMAARRLAQGVLDFEGIA